MFFPLFLTGGFGYCGLEYIWRGYTHWTMFILGGLCLYLIVLISIRYYDVPLLLQAFIGGFLITCMEFVTGVIVNIVLSWNVWSYSSVPFNLMGQICLPYSVLWVVLCVPILLFCRFFIKKVGKTAKIFH